MLTGTPTPALAEQRDLRDSAPFKEAEALYRRARAPGTGQVSDASEVNASPDGRSAVLTGTMIDVLEGLPSTRICHVDVASGDLRVLTFGPNSDKHAKFSRDGRTVAFLSDRCKKEDFQLYLLDRATGAARATPQVNGWVEYLHWSPDGQRVLLGVAGHGADVAGSQGAITTKQADAAAASWMPSVESGDETFRWRRAWIYDTRDDSLRAVGPERLNVWEAEWCGNDALIAVTSPGPGEGLWYSAKLEIIDLKTDTSRVLYVPADHLGWPSAPPSGACVAVVEAVCSDRWVVAGDLRLIDPKTGTVERIDTRGIDVTHTAWTSERTLLLNGFRGFELALGSYDVGTKTFTEHWASAELGVASHSFKLSAAGSGGDVLAITESFFRAPELARLRRGGRTETIRSFAVQPAGALRTDGASAGEAPSARPADPDARVERVTWKAPDGLEIQGWVVRPEKGQAPYPLIMMVHGGPVSTHRPRWLGRGPSSQMLLDRGFALFYPNPRGSSSRGQAFARLVFGDMAGADTHDYLSGVDELVRRGLADPKRLGVTGGSYGGYMSSWLITQDPRFAAAVPVAPMTNCVTEHLISNIPHFVKLFLDDRYDNPDGKYFTRSPVMYAHNVKTPTLNITGALDRCTPPEEAMQFHNALLENGVRSVLAVYPQEGHGVRRMPALFDYSARLVSWFDEHIPR